MHITENLGTAEQMLMAKAAQVNTPINGSIELLPLCNMNCDMCYVRLSREEMERLGRLRSVDEWLEVAKQMQQEGTLFLLLTGGEPLLYPGFKTLFLELRKMGMILTINTNGTLIDKEWADFFGENKPRRINITMYGAGEDTYRDLCHYPGGFEKVINGIRLLKEKNVDVKLGGSLTRTNQDEVEQIIKIGEELDVPVRIDTYMLPAQREREKSFDMQSRALPKDAAHARICALSREMGKEKFCQYKDLMLENIQKMEDGEERPRTMSCYAGNCSYTINWQGEMRPCVIMSEPAMSVFEYGFTTAWKHIVDETAKLLLNAKCSTCKYRPLCRTCAASALYETGSYDGVPVYMCEYAKTSYEILKSDGVPSF